MTMAKAILQNVISLCCHIRQVAARLAKLFLRGAFGTLQPFEHNART